MPTARYGIGVGVVGLKIHVIGGYNAGFLNTHEAYTLPNLLYVHLKN
jgi:hypothetical protein